MLLLVVNFHFHCAHTLKHTGQPPGPSVGQLCPEASLSGEAHQQTPGATGDGSDRFPDQFIKRSLSGRVRRSSIFTQCAVIMQIHHKQYKT